MKWIYIVTRKHTDQGAVPNLGVFTSLKAATAHFEAVKRHRLERGLVCTWDVTSTDPHDRRTREAYLFKGDEVENLRLERWATQRGPTVTHP